MISTPAFPIHTFFECPAGSADGSWLSLDHAWVWIIMFLSQVNIRSSDYSNLECQPWLGLSLGRFFLLLRFLDAAVSIAPGNFFVKPQAWISSHIWTPKSRRLAATDQIFGCRNYIIMNILIQIVLGLSSFSSGPPITTHCWLSRA